MTVTETETVERKPPASLLAPCPETDLRGKSVDEGTRALLGDVRSCNADKACLRILYDMELPGDQALCGEQPGGDGG